MNAKTTTKIVLALLITVIVPFTLTAQKATRTEELRSFSAQRASEMQLNKEAASEIARERQLPLTMETPEGRYAELQSVDEYGNLQYYITDNANAAKTISTNKVLPGGTSGLNLTGQGVTGRLWDAGAVLTTHQEFGGRVVMGDGSTSLHYHSTHCAGTMVASGVVASTKGMAPAANLRAFDWNLDESEMATEASNGALVSSHSYGYVRGWYYTGSSWIWYGNTSVSTQEDYLFGFYDAQAHNWDQIAYNAPYYLICKSAGNDRGEGPTGGAYPVDGPYDCIANAAVGKNILTVGAVNDITSGYTGTSSVVMTSFSCWGPVDDSRVKPDIVANGLTLYSTDKDNNADYRTLSGTSMSTPSVAGSLLLLQNHYQNTHNGGSMLASTLKGLVINTADEAGTTAGPDYQFGWGLMNTNKAAERITADVNSNVIEEQVLNNNATYNVTISAIGGSIPLKVTICWTDVAGTPVSAQLDPTTPMLVNDLDANLTYNGTTYFPWKLSAAAPTSAATNNSENDVDNVEVIFISSPVAGDYTLTVDHDGTLAGGSQAFSIIVSGGTIVSNQPPAANFIANDTIPSLGNTTLFTDLTSNNPTSWSWSISPANYYYVNGTGTASQNPQVYFNQPGDYTVTLTAANASGDNTVTRVNYITVTAPTGIQLPYSESFENGFGAWTQSTSDDFDWTRKSGPTGTNKTGPKKAYDGTYYVYTEASSPRIAGDEASIEATFNFYNTVNPTLTFFYHMYGSQMGSLHVDVYDGTNWNSDLMVISGQQQPLSTSPYLQATLNLSAYSNMFGIKIRFRGVIGSGEKSDICIDLVEVSGTNVNLTGLPSIGTDVADPETEILPEKEEVTPANIYSYSNRIVVEPGTGNNPDGLLRITNLNGQVVYQSTVNVDSRNEISTSMNTGIYVVTLVTPEYAVSKKLYLNN